MLELLGVDHLLPVYPSVWEAGAHTSHLQS